MDYWWSTCKYCGTPLVRDPIDGWRKPTEQELAVHRGRMESIDG